MAIHIVLKNYYNIDFGDLIVSTRDPKVGRDPPVEKHCSPLQTPMHPRDLTIVTIVDHCSEMTTVIIENGS